MEMKQSQQKYAENLEEVRKRLLPSVLSATKNNGDLIGNWLVKNCSEAEGAIVDASVANILKAIETLDKIPGLLDWEIPPVKKPAKKRPDFLQTNEGRRVTAREAQDREQDILMSQERKRREALGDAANTEIMSEAVALVRNHTNFPHSRAIRERDVLKKEFDRLVAAKMHPKDVLAAIQAKRATFEGEDITRPRLSR